MFVSGGGNDFAGFNDLRPLLGVDCSACTSEDACFNHGTAPGTIEELFDRVQAIYIELIDRIAAQVPAAARIFVHNYDYALPTGQGGDRQQGVAQAGAGRRQGAGRPARRVRPLPHRPVLAAPADLQTIYAGRVVFIDSRGTLDPTDWANELHPKAEGFGKIAESAMEAGAGSRPACA